MSNLIKKLFSNFFFQLILIVEELFLEFILSLRNRVTKTIFFLFFLYFTSVSSIFAQVCGTSGLDGPQNAFPPVNTYFPLATNASLPAGSKSITLLGVPPNDPNFNFSYGVTPIKSGDLILIIQMQDAEANFNNSNQYGSGNAANGPDNLGGTGYTSLGNSGKFEYVVATSDVSLTGGLLKFRGVGAGGGVVNSYTNSAFTATRGQRRFQIIRVPQYSTLVLSSNITAPPYNGSVGGIIAFDVAGTMQFNGFSIDASEKGFRAGYGPVALSGPNTSTVYAASSVTSTRSVGKGEGIAGTPRYVWDGFNQIDNGGEGLPGGSYGRGAPGNAGGGGNDHNAGGGGGGNAGFGGIGGRGFQGVGGNLNPLTGGGRPGSSIPSDFSRLIMGGGGGGGDANDATSGIKGGIGGGIIIINVQKIEGAGIIRSNGGIGEAGAFDLNSDGAGGGGAGGSIFVRALSASPMASLTLQANGGKGGNALDAGINPHGPGGGGGGGFIYTQITSATITTTTVGGISGKTFNGAGITHGATDGINGNATSFTTTDLPSYLQGGGSICYPILTTTLTEINAGAAGIRNPGSTATYKLKVANNTGVGNAGGVNVDFQLPFGFTLNTVSVVLSGDAAGPTLPTFTIGASGKVTFGTYNISPGDFIEFTILVNISTTIPSGIYHASSQATYLDPTRTNINPVRKITANNNPFTGTNTVYETGGITNVPGVNYNGDLNTSIVEDVYINAVPSAADCSAVINGNFTVATPGVYDGPNYLGSWKVAKPGDKVKIQASISDNSNNVAFIQEGFSLQQTIQTLEPSTNYSLNFKYVRNNVCNNTSSESKIKVQILDASTLTLINGLDINYNTADSKTGTIPFTTGASTTGIILKIFDDNSPTNSCAILIDDIIITSPIDFEIQKTNVSCNGASDGSFSVVALSGGVGPYTISYSLDNGLNYSTAVPSGVISVSGTPYTVTGLPAGAYKIRILDQNGCGDPSKDITINQPDVLDLTGSNTTILCNGSTSNITLSATGGTAPYRYSINNGVTFQTQNTFPNLVAGSYTFLVRDANNCSDTFTISIAEPNELTLSVVQNSTILCFKGSASVTLTAAGGTGIYEYSNDGITYQTGNTFTNILAGNQTFRVRDANKCITSEIVSILQPSKLTLTSDSSAITCNGETSTVTLTGSGGTGAYQFSKDGSIFQSSNIFSNLLAGTHIFTIKDVNNCLGTDTVIINQPTALILSGTSSTILCNGGISTVNLTGSGGTGAYQYSKDGTNYQASNSFTNLLAGSYTFTIKDANNCIDTEIIIISQPVTLSLAGSNTPILCNGQTSTVTLTGSGGTGSYQYSKDGINFQASNSFTNLVAGSYTFTLKDANNCFDTENVTISQPTSLTLTATQVNINCNGDSSGSINVNISGGTGPYTFIWSNGATALNQSNLPAGTYTITVNDANNCQTTQSIILTQPVNITVTASTFNVKCFGEATGSINLTVSGGTAPYSYLWNNGATSEDLSGLTAGSYNLTVTDSKGCLFFVTIPITQPLSPISVTETHVNNTCFAENQGSIDLTVSGGVAPYTYSWSNGSTIQDINNLAPGNYTVTIKDANNCVIIKTIAITPLSPFIVTNSQTNVLCKGATTGEINLSLSGGTLPYVIAWSNGSTGASLKNLTAGTYTYTARDNNGCEITNSITITEPPLLTISGTNSTILCNGDLSTVTLSSTGGTGAYQYSKDGTTFQNSNTFPNLSVGAYTFSVKDANNCIKTLSITITQPVALSVTELHQNILCFGQATGSINISITGGTAPFTYNWNNGATSEDLSNLIAGSYTVIITDANQCKISKTIIISQPASPLNITNTNQNISCFGNASGAINITVNGGTAPYSYAWNNGAQTKDLSALVAGSYTVTVTDVNNCSATKTIILTQPLSSLAATEIHQNVNCFGGASGAIDISVSGGTSPYQYLWNNNATTQDVNALIAGNYNVIITDANNCKTTLNVVIQQPLASLSMVESHQDIKCFGDATGNIILTLNGGTAPYTYLWNNGITKKDLYNVVAGTYNVVVTDANGCTIGKQIQITQPAVPLNITEIHQNVKCFGESSGSIDITVTGGTAPYSYLWGNGSTNQDPTNLPAGTYNVTVTDNNGCLAIKQVQVSQPLAPLSLSETHIDNVCFGDRIGAISLSVSGGTAPYNYKWNTGQATQNLSNLGPGVYQVTVTDAALCTKTISVIITPLQAFVVKENIQNVKCFNENTGSINLNLSGGESPYTITWSNGATGSQLSNLKAGNYTYKAVDANGCTLQKTITITQPQALAATFVVTNTTCKFSPDGAINLNITGGTAPFKYTWNGLDRGPSASLINITSGKYIITITDANSCSIFVNTEVLPGNCAPNADNDKYITNEDTPITIKTPGVIVNDVDPDQDELKIMLNTVRDPNAAQGSVNGNISSFNTVNGGVFINNNGSFTYTPKKNFNGIERFVYKVSDGSLLSNFATVTIEVLAVNDPPIAIDDNYNTLEDTPFDGTVIPNDSDPDSDILTYRILAQPTNAVVSFNANGTFRFVPVANFNGTVIFNYQVCDPLGLCDTASVTVIVAPVNDPPVALDDTFKTEINIPFNNRVIDNDSDVENDPLQFSALTQPVNGTLIFNTNGSFTYTPRNGFKGTDTFTYRACDPSGLCDNATVTILVQPIVTVNLTPSTATIKEGDKISITATLTESIFEDAIITLGFGGSATNNSDYNLTGNFVTITILAGQTTSTQQFTINSINDALRDDGEQVIANVTATSTPYVLIGTGSFVNITDIYPVSIPLKPEENPDINPDPLVSPNKDGQGNDKFIIYNISKYSDNEVFIFNRWGNEVFKIAGYNNTDKAFEGIANVGILTNTSKELVDGVYYYVIYTTVNGVKNINRGYLILKR